MQIVILYTDAGGGHRAAAETLRHLLEQGGGYRVTLVNPYREIHPQLDVYARWTRYDGERVYNELVVEQGRTGLFCLAYYGIVLASIRLQAPAGRRIYRDYFAGARPDLVISVLPMLNRVIIDSLKAPDGSTTTPVAVLMTDWMEILRGSWYPRGRDYYAICATSVGSTQLADGRRGAAVFHLSGGLIHPAFLNAVPNNRAAARTAMGLDPHQVTLCFLYGGYGNWRMKELALALREAQLRLQAIFLCGKNLPLAEVLRGMEWPFQVVIQGFTREVPRYLGVSDVFVGKPGPGSVREALTLSLDLLLDRTTALPQERPMLRWVEQEGLGHAFSDLKAFVSLVRKHCAKIQAKAREPQPIRPPANPRAARQLPDIVAEILRLGPPGASGFKHKARP